VTELGRGIDEFERDLLQGTPRNLGNQRLPEGEDPLLDSDGGSFDHQKIFVDDAVMWETSHRVDGLFGEINGGATRILVGSFTDAVDLFVDLGPVVVTVLTGAGD